MKKNQLVVLMTDFGVKDTYVAVMKGILLAAVPSIQIVDLTHAILPQDVRSAAYELMVSVDDFPKGTLFICVVDPGVGSLRKIIYAEVDGRRYMAPDNGLLSWIFEKKKPSRLIAVVPEASLKKKISQTFHGRDIFAPVAGRILKGVPVSKIGSPHKQWVKLPFPSVKKTGSQWKGEILHVDEFGNLITTFLSNEIEPLAKTCKVWFEFSSGEKSFSIRGLVSSYSVVEEGQLLAIAGSAGFIEISIRNGNAAQITELKARSPITVHFRV